MMYALLTRLSGAHLRVATPQVGPDRDLWRNRIFYAGDEVEQDTNISYTRTTLMVNTLITLNTTGRQSVKVEQVNTTTSVNCAFTFTYYIRKGLVKKLVCGVYTIYISSLAHDIPSLPSPPCRSSRHDDRAVIFLRASLRPWKGPIQCTRIPLII